MDYGTLPLLQHSDCHACPLVILCVFNSVALTCISKGFAESGKETLCPWETRQANSSKTENCSQVVTGNMIRVAIYLVRSRKEQGRERVREWWLQECPAGDVSCSDLCWDLPENG